MIVYKDMSFCNQDMCPKWKTCYRALTEEIKKEAFEFGLPYSYIQPEKTPCDEYWPISKK